MPAQKTVAASRFGKHLETRADDLFWMFTISNSPTRVHPASSGRFNREVQKLSRKETLRGTARFSLPVIGRGSVPLPVIPVFCALVRAYFALDTKTGVTTNARNRSAH